MRGSIRLVLFFAVLTLGVRIEGREREPAPKTDAEKDAAFLDYLIRKGVDHVVQRFKVPIDVADALYRYVLPEVKVAILKSIDEDPDAKKAARLIQSGRAPTREMFAQNPAAARLLAANCYLGILVNAQPQLDRMDLPAAERQKLRIEASTAESLRQDLLVAMKNNLAQFLGRGDDFFDSAAQMRLQAMYSDPRLPQDLRDALRAYVANLETLAGKPVETQDKEVEKQNAAEPETAKQAEEHVSGVCPHPDCRSPHDKCKKGKVCQDFEAILKGKDSLNRLKKDVLPGILKLTKEVPKIDPKNVKKTVKDWKGFAKKGEEQHKQLSKELEDLKKAKAAFEDLKKIATKKEGWKDLLPFFQQLGEGADE